MADSLRKGHSLPEPPLGMAKLQRRAALSRTGGGRRWQVADESEIQLLASKAGISIEWLCRNGAEPGALLVDAVRRVPFPGEGTTVFAWAGC